MATEMKTRRKRKQRTQTNSNGNDLANFGRRWTRRRNARLLELMAQSEEPTSKITLQSIATELGTTESACTSQYLRLLKERNLSYAGGHEHECDTNTNTKKPNEPTTANTTNPDSQNHEELPVFLSKSQVLALTAGKYIDHKHENGRWYEAKVLANRINGKYLRIEPIYYGQQILIDYTNQQNIHGRFAEHGTATKPIFVPSLQSMTRCNGSHGMVGSCARDQMLPDYNSLLLRDDEIARLRVHDRFDHRNGEGKFVPAQIVQHDPMRSVFVIQYEDGKTHTCNYSWLCNTQRRFAKYQSISTRACTRFQRLRCGVLVRCKISAFWENKNGIKNVEYGSAEIVALDVDETLHHTLKSGQIQVFHREKGVRYWYHPDDAHEVNSIQVGGGYDEHRDQNHNHHHLASQTGQIVRHLPDLSRFDALAQNHSSRCILTQSSNANRDEELENQHNESPQARPDALANSGDSNQTMPRNAASHHFSVPDIVETSPSNPCQRTHHQRRNIFQQQHMSDSTPAPIAVPCRSQNHENHSTLAGCSNTQHIANKPALPPLPPTDDILTAVSTHSAPRISCIHSRNVRPRKRTRNRMMRYCDEEDDSSSGSERDSDFDDISEPPFKRQKVGKLKVWNTKDVLEWFADVGYAHYVDVLRPHFKEVQMDGRGLKYMDMDDLMRFGVTNFYESKQILRKIKNLRF